MSHFNDFLVTRQLLTGTRITWIPSLRYVNTILGINLIDDQILNPHSTCNIHSLDFPHYRSLSIKHMQFTKFHLNCRVATTIALLHPLFLLVGRTIHHHLSNQVPPMQARQNDVQYPTSHSLYLPKS